MLGVMKCKVALKKVPFSRRSTATCFWLWMHELTAHQEAITECLRSLNAGSLSKMSSSRRRLEPDVEMEN